MGTEFDKVVEDAKKIFWSLPEDPWVDEKSGRVDFGHTRYAAEIALRRVPILKKTVLIEEILSEDLGAEANLGASDFDGTETFHELIDQLISSVIDRSLNDDQAIEYTAEVRNENNEQYWLDHGK